MNTILRKNVRDDNLLDSRKKVVSSIIKTFDQGKYSLHGWKHS